MLRQINYQALLFFGLAIGAMLILASGVSNIQFVPESFIQNISNETQSGTPLVAPRFVENEFFFIVAFALLILAIVSTILVPEGRAYLMRFILLAVVLFLFSRLFHPRNPTQTLQIATPDTVNTMDTSEFQQLTTPQPDLNSNLGTPDWLVTVAGISLALLIVSGIAAIFWFISHQRHSISTPDVIIREARSAVDALETGGDFQDVILRSYARMSQVLSEQRSIYRESTMTPHEFERLLIKLGFPPEPVRTITHLFEEVRYGSIPQGENGIQMAISSLNAIIFYCKSTEPI
jgi:hypothetical protein